MSQSNSKNRKSNFSNNPLSESQSSLNTPYNSNFKPQAPSGQPSFSNHNANRPQGQTSESFDPFPPVKAGNDRGSGNFQPNPPNNGFPPFYPQPPTQNDQNQSMNFHQPPNYPNYSNAGLEFQQNIGNFPNYGQNVNNLLPGYLDFNPANLGTQMIEEEIPEMPAGESKNPIKRARKEPEGINEELEVIHKKNKTENQYSERLQILANELAKVKEFEVQTIKALFNTPTMTASTVKGRKEWDNLVSQRMSLANIQPLYPDFLTEAALQNIPHEALKGVLTDLLSRKPRDATQLETAKKDLIDQVHKEQDDEKREGRVEEEKEELCKVVHISTQQFYQANPAIKEYEDKLERMEVVLRDKKAKIREATKKVGSTKFELDIALAKWEIANRRVKEMEPLADS